MTLTAGVGGSLLSVGSAAGVALMGQARIAEIYDRDGRLQERFFPHSERVMAEAVTYLALYMLRGVVERGTGVSARWLDANLAGKTGTTDNLRDSWFAGFSSDYVTVVWVGRDDNKPSRLSGSSGAMRVWENLMLKLDQKQRILPENENII